MKPQTLGEGAGEVPRDLDPTMRPTADGAVRCIAARLPKTCTMARNPSQTVPALLLHTQRSGTVSQVRAAVRPSQPAEHDVREGHTQGPS